MTSSDERPEPEAVVTGVVDETTTQSHPPPNSMPQSAYTKIDIARACDNFRAEEERSLAVLRFRQGKGLLAEKHHASEGFVREVATELGEEPVRLYEIMRVASLYESEEELHVEMAKHKKDMGRQLTYSDLLARTVKTSRKSGDIKQQAKTSRAKKSPSQRSSASPDAASQKSSEQPREEQNSLAFDPPTSGPGDMTAPQKNTADKVLVGSLTAINNVIWMIEKETKHALGNSPDKEQVDRLREVIQRALTALTNAAQALEKHVQTKGPSISSQSPIQAAVVQAAESEAREPGSTEIRTSPQPSPNQPAPDAELASPILQMPAPRPFLPIPYAATRQASPHYEPEQPNPQTVPGEPVEGVDNDH